MSKTNKAGRECPAWCETDHEAIPYSCTRHGPGVTTAAGRVWAGNYLGVGEKDTPEVILARADYTIPENKQPAGRLEFTTRATAETAAVLIDRLAACSPDAHREIAGQLRQAAADAYPEPEAG
jgi:hypothetical protein